MQEAEKTDNRIVVAHRTHIGKTHRVNQDSGGAWRWRRGDGSQVSLAVVADGVSAGLHSEEASKLAVDIILQRVGEAAGREELDLKPLLEHLRAAAIEANHEVARRPYDSISAADATTLVAALCLDSGGGGVWCGDSRAYLVSSQDVVSLTRDHSWAEGIVDQGLMTAEMAARDPRSRMITRWLGPPDEDDPGVETFEFNLAPGRAVLCCSDGLSLYFSPPYGVERELTALVRGPGEEFQRRVDLLVESALERGGHDDVSAAAILQR